jgi:hypothetical protein
MAIVRLTHRGILSLPADGGKRAEYHDELTPGLCLRVSPSGSRSWSVLAHVRGLGRNVRVKIGDASFRGVRRAVLA